MKMKKSTISAQKTFVILLLLFVNIFSVNAQENGGQLIDTIIPAPSLKENLLQIPLEQPVAVYLPPSYKDSGKKYPVVYYLPGFGTPTRYYTQYGAFQGFFLKNAMDQLINEKKIKDMIVVIPNAVNIFGGHFYVNSPVTGNWEDFIVKDLVSFIDKTYRTLVKPESRGIAGHSMGGFGALNLAMLHPDVFGVTYAISPGLFDKEGINKHLPLTGERYIKAFFEKQEELSKMEECKALANLLYDGFHEFEILGDSWTAFCFAYGVAFSPNPNTNPPFINYLYDKKDEKIVKNEKNWEAYESGFGNLEEKVKKYEKNLLSLKAIYIDYGTNDEYTWIPEGCEYFSGLLDNNNIEHKLLKHEAGHGDNLRERLEKFMLPSFSEQLQF